MSHIYVLYVIGSQLIIIYKPNFPIMCLPKVRRIQCYIIRNPWSFVPLIRTIPLRDTYFILRSGEKGSFEPGGVLGYTAYDSRRKGWMGARMLRIEI